MSDDDDVQGPGGPKLPEYIADNWEVGQTEVVLEDDGMRVIVELLPRVEGAEPTKVEIHTRPF
jgi:hypothetical protein